MKLLVITDKRNKLCEEHDENSLVYAFFTTNMSLLYDGEELVVSDRYSFVVEEEEERTYSAKEDPSDAAKRMRDNAEQEGN